MKYYKLQWHENAQYEKGLQIYKQVPEISPLVYSTDIQPQFNSSHV
jgi:hypothetical protein